MGRQPPTSDEGFDTVVKMGFVQMGGTGDMGGAFVTSGEELDRAVGRILLRRVVQVAAPRWGLIPLP